MLAVCMALIDSHEDKTLFQKLYEQYVKLMLYTANRILNNQQDAEDAVSEAFLRIAQNFSKVEKNICTKTANQFVIIVRNISIDIYRKKQRKKEVSFSNDINIAYCDDFEAADNKVLFSELNQNDKDILYLHYIYGKSIKDIAKLFAISENAVYKRIQRAKSRYEKSLNQNGSE